jgi:hypothetical protein
MAAREDLSNTREADVERSTEDIRQDIAKKEETISRTVEQIRDRITEKLDWRGYVKGSPYWALGAAIGLGYLASGMLRTRTTSMERITDPIAEAGRDSIDDVRAEAAGPDQGDPAGYCREGSRRLDEEFNLDSCGTQRHRASTADGTRFNL